MGCRASIGEDYCNQMEKKKEGVEEKGKKRDTMRIREKMRDEESEDEVVHTKKGGGGVVM